MIATASIGGKGPSAPSYLSIEASDGRPALPFRFLSISRSWGRAMKRYRPFSISRARATAAFRCSNAHGVQHFAPACGRSRLRRGRTNAALWPGHAISRSADVGIRTRRPGLSRCGQPWAIRPVVGSLRRAGRRSILFAVAPVWNNRRYESSGEDRRAEERRNKKRRIILARNKPSATTCRTHIRTEYGVSGPTPIRPSPSPAPVPDPNPSPILPTPTASAPAPAARKPSSAKPRTNGPPPPFPPPPKPAKSSPPRIPFLRGTRCTKPAAGRVSSFSAPEAAPAANPPHRGSHPAHESSSRAETNLPPPLKPPPPPWNPLAPWPPRRWASSAHAHQEPQRKICNETTAGSSSFQSLQSNHSGLPGRNNLPQGTLACSPPTAPSYSRRHASRQHPPNNAPPNTLLRLFGAASTQGLCSSEPLLALKSREKSPNSASRIPE